MSAESKQSQQSIDDILSSIREIIADDGVERDNTQSRDAPDRTGTATSHDDGAAAAEDVLDLSEEFIVTEAGAAAPREQEQQAQADAERGNAGDEAPEPGADDGDDEDEPAASEAQDTAGDHAGMTQAAVWAQDFQMPVADDGPTSPFTAARTHPESAWPSDNSFDVTESYKLARSRDAGAQFTREPPQEAEPEAAVQETEDAEETEGAEHAETPDAAEQDGIELTSFSEPPEDGDGDAGTPSDETDGQEHDPPTDAVGPPTHHFHDADEIEAAFGMQPRGWAGPSESASAQAGATVPEDTHTAEAETMAEHDTNHDESAADPIAHAAATGAKSLEESVKELLRPMLAEWLERNMPRLVEAAMREQTAASQEARSDEAGADRDPAAPGNRADR